ncbi:MAG: nitroreductase family protein [Ignavibacteriales bacterium]
MELFEAIRKRRSCRNFVPGSIPREDLLRMVDCARLAPSASNSQKWRFVVTSDQGLVAEILSHIPKTNKYYPTNEQGYFEGTNAIITVALPGNWAYSRQDAGAAVQTICLAATALGYGSCWVEGQLQGCMEHLRRILTVPEDYEIRTMVMLGRVQKWPEPPPKKGLDDVVSWQTW